MISILRNGLMKIKNACRQAYFWAKEKIKTIGQTAQKNAPFIVDPMVWVIGRSIRFARLSVTHTFALIRLLLTPITFPFYWLVVRPLTWIAQRIIPRRYVMNNVTGILVDLFGFLLIVLLMIEILFVIYLMIQDSLFAMIITTELLLGLLVYKLGPHFLRLTENMATQFADWMINAFRRFYKTCLTSTILLETLCNGAVLWAAGLFIGMPGVLILQNTLWLLAQSVSRNVLSAIFIKNTEYDRRQIWKFCLRTGIFVAIIGTLITASIALYAGYYGWSLASAAAVLIPTVTWTALLSIGAIISLPQLCAPFVLLFHKASDLFIQTINAFRFFQRRTRRTISMLLFLNPDVRFGKAFLSPIMQKIIMSSIYLTAAGLILLNLAQLASWIIALAAFIIPYIEPWTMWFLHPLLAMLPLDFVMMETVICFSGFILVTACFVTHMLAHTIYRGVLTGIDWIISRYAYQAIAKEYKENIATQRHITIPEKAPNLYKSGQQGVTQLLANAKCAPFTLDLTHTNNAAFLAKGYLQNPNLKGIFLDLTQPLPHNISLPIQGEAHWCIQVPPCYKAVSHENRTPIEPFQETIKRIDKLWHQEPGAPNILTFIQLALDPENSPNALLLSLRGQINSLKNKHQENSHEHLEREIAQRAALLDATITKLQTTVKAVFIDLPDIIEYNRPERLSRRKNPVEDLHTYFRGIPEKTRETGNFSNEQLNAFLEKIDTLEDHIKENMAEMEVTGRLLEYKEELKHLKQLCEKLTNRQSLAQHASSAYFWVKGSFTFSYDSSYCISILNSMHTTTDTAQKSLLAGILDLNLILLKGTGKISFTNIQEHIAPDMANPLTSLMAYYNEIPVITRESGTFSDVQRSTLIRHLEALKAWPEAMLMAVKKYNETLKKEYGNPQSIAQRIFDTMKQLSRWPTSITLLGASGGNTGERMGYRSQIMKALRALFQVQSKPIHFKSARSLKVLVHAL